MWNNLKNPQERPSRSSLVKRIVVFAVVVVAVCSAVGLILFQDSLNIDALRRWVKYFNIRDEGEQDIYAFDSHNSNRYGAAGSGLAVASVGGLTYYQDNGTERFSLQQQLELPQLLTAGKMMLAYDVGGTALLAADTGGERLNLTADQAILDADLSSGGSLCYSSGSSGYKSVLTVYNAQQELIYRWLSSTTYMPQCAISEKGNFLAAVGLGASGGAFESTLHLFRTDAEGVLWTASLAYPEPYLKEYDLGGDGFLALAVNMYRAGNRNSLVTVSETGEEIASVYLGREILDLSACGGYVAVLTPDQLTIYNKSLEVYAETSDIGTATAVLMRADGSALLLGGGAGWLYLP